MTTQRSGQLGEDLKKLLRRIEEIPAADAGLDSERAEFDTFRSSVLGKEGRTTDRTLGRSANAVQGKRGLLIMSILSVGAVGMVATAVLGWTLLVEHPARINATGGIEAHPGQPAEASPDGSDIRTSAVINVAKSSARARPQDAGSGPRAHGAKPSLSIPEISAAPGDRVRFPVRVEQGSLGSNAFRVRVQGLPKQAQLSAGRFVPPDSWIVPAGDLDTVDLMLGGAAAGRFEFVAELQALDGRALAQAKSSLLVTAPPASRSAGVTGTPTAASISGLNAPVSGLDDNEQTQEKFVAHGLRLLVTGNVNSARLLFERAADAGNAQAALLLGDTYDDVRLAQLGVQGVVPNRDKANYWYGRADELGSPEAKERLSDINSR